MTVRRLTSAFALVCVLASTALLSGCGAAGYAVTAAAIAHSATQKPVVHAPKPATWPCTAFGICE